MEDQEKKALTPSEAREAIMEILHNVRDTQAESLVTYVCVAVKKKGGENMTQGVHIFGEAVDICALLAHSFLKNEKLIEVVRKAICISETNDIMRYEG